MSSTLPAPTKGKNPTPHAAVAQKNLPVFGDFHRALEVRRRSRSDSMSFCGSSPGSIRKKAARLLPGSREPIASAYLSPWPPSPRRRKRRCRLAIWSPQPVAPEVWEAGRAGSLAVDRRKLLLEGLVEDLAAIVAQEDEELGALYESHHRSLFGEGSMGGLQICGRIKFSAFARHHLSGRKPALATPVNHYSTGSLAHPRPD